MIYFIRHGQTDWNLEHRVQGHQNIPLNASGRKKARILAHQLSSLKIEKLYSSDLLRALETAQIINQFWQLPIQEDKRLREFSFGCLEGELAGNLTQEVFEILNNNPTEFGAEAKEAIYCRVKAFCEDLDKTKNTLIITHGGFLRMMMYYVQHQNSFNLNEFIPYLIIKLNNLCVFEWQNENCFVPKEIEV